MSVESTREAMERYWVKDDLSVVAEDAVYTDTSTGRDWVGRDKVSELLEFMYRRAFDGSFKTLSRIVGDGQAVIEGRFQGRHIGDFLGVAPTGRDVDAPICVVYDLEDDRIKRARVYLQTYVVLQQLGAIPAAAGRSASASNA
ncbi:MAG TPA: ester cyclase [Candidatus Limnocylindrales bacterium]|jgi:predicted ester cyclase|nr:ester cyclase [Candidatus Limnocylindrales bacterium]